MFVRIREIGSFNHVAHVPNMPIAIRAIVAMARHYGSSVGISGARQKSKDDVNIYCLFIRFQA
jgi:hypothetical protein